VTLLAVVDANEHPNRKRHNKRADLKMIAPRNEEASGDSFRDGTPPKRALCLVTETESRPMALQKVRMMAETTEPESPPKKMGSLKAALTARVPAKAWPKEPMKLSAMARTRGFLKAAWTSTAPAKASRKEPLKADRIVMERGKMMALMRAPWKSTASVKELTKAGPTELASRPMAFQKVRTMAEPREIEI
jgi:hypothetical protein